MRLFNLLSFRISQEIIDEICFVGIAQGSSDSFLSSSLADVCNALLFNVMHQYIINQFCLFF